MGKTQSRPLVLSRLISRRRHQRMTSLVDLEAAAEEEDSVEEEVATEAMEVATTTARDMVVAMEAMTTARDMVVVMEATTTARDMETKVDMEVVMITRGADTVVRTAMEEVVGQVTAAKASSWTRRKSKTCVLNSRQLELLCCLGHMQNERQSYLFHQTRKKFSGPDLVYMLAPNELGQ